MNLRLRSSLDLVVVVVGLWLLPVLEAAAQVYVAPRRPGQSIVRYYEQDWFHEDLLVGEALPQGTAGGIRLFFYETERENAELAAAAIRQAYLTYAEIFDYVPSRRFDYILYGSYQEFLRTNLFPIQEGVLGITSTRSLEIALPYRGDHRAFLHVSTHELAHEFTIQKLRDVADEAEVRGDPLDVLPLWFAEGVAEYYAQAGMDDEARMILRDIVANPDPLRVYGLFDFFFDYAGSTLWTYKLGQARTAFLEETYGEGTVQRIMDEIAWIFDPGESRRRNRTFKDLVEKITGDDPEKVNARFESWAKRQAFPGWLAGEQDRSVVDVLDVWAGTLNALDASTDGTLLMYRTLARDTGRTWLYLVDPRNPDRRVEVAREGVPGVESLHPVDDRNFDLAKDSLVFVAERHGHDVIYRVPVKLHEAKQKDLEDSPEVDDEERWNVKIKLGRREVFPLEEHGLVAAFSPSLSPDEKRVAFVGLTWEGRRDVFVLDLEGESAGRLVQLTGDRFAERHTAWGPDGVVYNSDSTNHHFFNLFRVDPDAPGAPEQLTTEARDHLTPLALPNGRTFFVTWREGHADIHEVAPGGILARTDMSTGVFEPSPAEDGGFWTLTYHGGRNLPARLPEDELRAGVYRETLPGAPAEPWPEASLEGAEPYQPLKISNWRPDMVFGILGAGAGAVYGQVYATASDRLRDRAVVLSAVVYGSFQLTDGYFMYLDQSDRVTWGGGPFQGLRFRIDRTFGDDLLFQSYERFIGAMGVARYPFNRFVYVQAEQSVGAVQYLLFQSVADDLADMEEGGRTLLDQWTDLHEALRFQEETTARIGWDTIRYHPKTGAVGGGSAMLEGSLAWQPAYSVAVTTLRADAERFFPLPLGSGANLGLRASGGTSFGGLYARSFYLSSYDSLRAVQFADPDFLLGRNFGFTTAELQVPLDAIIATAFTTAIEAVAGVDFGAVADDPEDLWDKRVLDVALGGNLILGPLVFRVHFARALDIGAPLPSDSWVPNISLSWLYL